MELSRHDVYEESEEFRCLVPSRVHWDDKSDSSFDTLPLEESDEKTLPSLQTMCYQALISQLPSWHTFPPLSPHIVDNIIQLHKKYYPARRLELLYYSLRYSLPSTLDLLDVRGPGREVLQLYTDAFSTVTQPPPSVTLYGIRMNFTESRRSKSVVGLVGRLLVLAGDDLRELILRGPAWTENLQWDDMLEKAVTLGAFRNLEVLELDWEVREIVLRKLLNVCGVRLRVLRVRQGQIPCDLNWEGNLTNLEVLDVAESSFSQYNLLSISSNRLRELDIGYCEDLFKEDALDVWPALLLMKHLRRLDISGSKGPVEALLETLSGSFVEELLLCHIKVGDMKRLVKALPRRLRLLDLSWSKGVDLPPLLDYNRGSGVASQLRHLSLHRAEPSVNLADFPSDHHSRDDTSPITTCGGILAGRGDGLDNLVSLDVSYCASSEIMTVLEVLKRCRGTLETFIMQEADDLIVCMDWNMFPALKHLHIPRYFRSSWPEIMYQKKFSWTESTSSMDDPYCHYINGSTTVGLASKLKTANFNCWRGLSERIQLLYLSRLGKQLTKLYIKKWYLTKRICAFIATRFRVLRVLDVKMCHFELDAYEILKGFCVTHPTLHTVITCGTDQPLQTRFELYAPSASDIIKKDSMRFNYEKEIESGNCRPFDYRFTYPVRELLSIRENSKLIEPLRDALTSSWLFGSGEILNREKGRNNYSFVDSTVE